MRSVVVQFDSYQAVLVDQPCVARHRQLHSFDEKVTEVHKFTRPMQLGTVLSCVFFASYAVKSTLF